MHSAFGARNVLFLAPLHNPRLRCVLRRRLRMSLRRVTTLPVRMVLYVSGYIIFCVHRRISAVSIFIAGLMKTSQNYSAINSLKDFRY
jgi:hypothetical protein